MAKVMVCPEGRRIGEEVTFCLCLRIISQKTVVSSLFSLPHHLIMMMVPLAFIEKQANLEKFILCQFQERVVETGLEAQTVGNFCDR